MEHSRRNALILLGVVVLWVLSGVVLPSAEETEKASLASKAVLAVKVEPLEAEEIWREVVVYGVTEPNRQVDIKAEAEGTITEIIAREGTVVEQGAPLLQINPRDRGRQLAYARALEKQRMLELKAAKKLEKGGYRGEIGLAQAQAALEQAKAERKRAELAMAYTTVRAPFAGIVERVHVELGDLVSNFQGPGFTGGAMLTMVQNDPLRVVGHVLEKDVLHLQVGQVAKAGLPNGSSLKCTLDFVARKAEEASRTFKVELSCPNPDNIPAGVTANLHVPIQKIHAYKFTPAAFSLDDAGVVGIKYLEAGGVVRFQPVQVEHDEADGFWVSGLPGKMRAITLGQAFVSDGQTLQQEDGKWYLMPEKSDEGN